MSSSLGTPFSDGSHANFVCSYSKLQISFILSFIGIHGPRYLLGSIRQKLETKSNILDRIYKRTIPKCNILNRIFACHFFFTQAIVVFDSFCGLKRTKTTNTKLVL